jgi:carbon storage regulator
MEGSLTMLVLSRKLGEKIVIGANVVVTVLSVHGNRLRLGIEAPIGIAIKRQELLIEEDREAAEARAAFNAR